MKKSLLIKTIILFVTASVFATVYFIIFNALKNKNQSIADQQASINSQIIKIEQSLDTKKQAEAVLTVGSNINKHFLKSSEVPIFLNKLESLGAKTGSVVKIVSVDEFQDPETGAGLSLNIIANGNYQAVYQVLVELENLQYYSSVNNVSLSIERASTDQDLGWALSANVLIKSYIK